MNCFKIYFTFIHMCLCVCHRCTGALSEARGGYSILGPELRPLEEQELLTTVLFISPAQFQIFPYSTRYCRITYLIRK